MTWGLKWDFAPKILLVRLQVLGSRIVRDVKLRGFHSFWAAGQHLMVVSKIEEPSIWPVTVLSKRLSPA